MFQRVSTTTSIEITSLHPFYVYEWTVSAFTVGEGPYSSISTVTTPEDGKNCWNSDFRYAGTIKYLFNNTYLF